MAKRKMPNLGPLNTPIRFICSQLPPLNFITIHYLYFISTCILSAIIFWGSSTPFRSVSFTDSLFFTTSAMTASGLNTVDVSDLNTFQQFLLFILFQIGSSIFVSAFVVHVRRKAFDRKFNDYARRRNKKGRRINRVGTWASDTLRGRSHNATGDEEEGPISPTAEKDVTRVEKEHTGSDTDANGSLSPQTSKSPGITFAADTRFPTSQAPQPVRRTNTWIKFNGVGAQPMGVMRPSTTLSLEPESTFQLPYFSDLAKKGREDISRYFDTAAGWIGRNSQFHGLTEEERKQLGGYEFRAVSLLAWLVPLYFIMWQLLGAIGCGAWVALNKPVAARSNGQNAWWSGAFLGVSAFTNAGMSLLDVNMIAFQRNYYMLLTVGLLVLAGNTCFPIFLRLIVWCMYKVAKRMARNKPETHPWTQRVQTLKFLLDHPRRCYTDLFPSKPTWWLALTVFSLNATDWIMFEILNLGNSQLESGLPARFRVVDGFFQAIAVRAAGFYVVPIPTLRISLQVLYMVMMYISAYPVVITMRNSNVYEERSLGIYADEQPEDGESEEHNKKRDSNPAPAGRLKRAKTIKDHFTSGAQAVATHESNGNYVRQQLRAQLAHDAWWIVLAVFLIMIVEGEKFQSNPAVFSVFNYMFEIVSAYGTVGLSVGVPWASYSFCGTWQTLSKLMLCAVMLRGRHRGLPVAIDKAVLLPKQEQGQAEEEDGRIKLVKAKTMRPMQDGSAV